MLQQALAPSLRVVSLPHFEFIADDTTSSHCDRTAEAPAQKLNLFSKPSVHSKRSAGVPQEILGQSGRTRATGPRPAPAPLGKCPDESLAIGVCRSSGPPVMGEELNGLIYGLLATPGRKLAGRWRPLPFSHFLRLGQKGKGGANLDPLGRISFFTPVTFLHPINLSN